jgi:hypothetical protein
MKEIHAVYAMMLGNELYYVGSSIHVRRRLSEHMRPSFAHHGPFGKYIHANSLTNDINMTILEKIKEFPGTRDQLKDELKRREFLWKVALPARFGQFDGLKFQPEEVRRAIQNKQNRATLAKRLQDPEYRAKYLERERNKQKRLRAKWSSDRRERQSDYMRTFYQKKAAREGRVRQERGKRRDIPFSVKRALQCARRRERRRLNYEESGFTYKPRRTREIRLYQLYQEAVALIGPVVAKCFEFL